MNHNEITKEFREKFKRIQSDCDGHGNIPVETALENVKSL